MTALTWNPVTWSPAPGHHGDGRRVGRPRRGPVLAMPVLGDQRPDYLRHPGHLIGSQVDDLAERLVPAPAPGHGVAPLQPAAIALVLQPARHRAQLRVAGRTGPGLLRRSRTPRLGQPPRADPAARGRSLLDHAMPGQLTQVKGVQAGAAAQLPSGLGSGDHAIAADQLQQRRAHRMGPQPSRVARLRRLVARLRRLVARPRRLVARLLLRRHRAAWLSP